MKIQTHLAAAVAALGMLVTGTSLAADAPKKEGAFGKGGGPLLSKEQLRTCLNLKAKQKQSDDELLKEQNAIGALKEDITRSGEALKAKLEALDRTNIDAVGAYNDESAARDKRIDDYQARVDAFNARVEAQKGERDKYSKGCENRRYLEDDEIAIQKGK